MVNKLLINTIMIGLAISMATGFAQIKFPFAKDLNVSITSINGNVVTLDGSVKIHYKNPQAWTDFGYKDNNFYFFNQYWISQEGKTFTSNGISVKLLNIDITLAQHTPSYDKLVFKITVQIL